MTETLFSPLTLRGITIRNRIAVSPMCEHSAVDGFANACHLVQLGSPPVAGAPARCLFCLPPGGP